MDYVLIAERLFEKFGLPGIMIGLCSWFVWKMIQPIINNINQSTNTLVEISSLLSAHNQNAMDMHITCREHGEYLCEAKDLLNTNRETIMIKLGEIQSEVKTVNTSIKEVSDNVKQWNR